MLTSKKSAKITALAIAGAVFLAAGATSAFAGGKDTPKASVVFDIAKRKKAKIALTDWLRTSLYTSLRYVGEQDLKRDDLATDKTNETVALFGFVLRADPGHGVVGYVNAEITDKDKSSNVRSYDPALKPQVKEALVSVLLGDNTQLNIGRLRFSDTHRWVADSSVDGVHVMSQSQGTAVELAAVSGTHKNTADYLVAHLSSIRAKKRHGGFAIGERDGNATRFHFSVYLHNTVSERFSYQLNTGIVVGDAANGKSSGAGFDVRAIQKLASTKLKPQITYGFAIGSPGFQQSGLHSNKTYDGGQTQFHRYGYVFKPELTNIAVGTVAYGLRPSRSFSIDLGLHAYVQPSRSITGPKARIKGITTGASSFLGTEISLVGAWRPNKKSKVEFGAGQFMPGTAFQDRSKAHRVYLRLSYYF